MWGTGDWSVVVPTETPLYKDFSELPPGKAKLVVRDARGRVVVQRVLEMPLAKLRAWSPSGRGEVFLVTQDYSIGFGSYNGPATTLVQVSDNAIREVTALDVKTKAEVLFTLVESLKSAWHLASPKNGNEILSVICRPESDDKFLITYFRYSFDGNRWIDYEREVEGFWEADNPFPSRSTFP
jgi:hypothetical protein